MPSPYEQGLPCLNTHCKSHGKSHGGCKCYGPGGPQAEGYAEGGEVSPIHYCAYGFPHHADCDYAKPPSRPEFADGGRAPVPEGGDATIQTGKEKLRQVGQAASGGNNQPTMDPRSWWAKGGDVGKPQTLNYEELRKRKREMNVDEASKPVLPKRKAEGGEVMQYAEGTGSVNPEEQLNTVTDAMDAGGEAGGDAGVDGPAAMAMPPANRVAAAPQAPPQGISQAQTQYAPPIQATHTPMQTDTPDEATKSMAQHTLEEDHKYAGDLDAGHITPKTYSDLFHEKSTLGKISTIFGVLASGMGSGLTHQPNAALQMMDNVINRDIDAQKESAHNKMTHWGMNYDHALKTAQANGMDAGSDLAKTQSALQADTWTKMQADRNTLAAMASYIKKMPEGPQKQKYAEAYSYLVKATDAAHVNKANEVDAQGQILNKQFGAPPTSTLQNPHPSVVMPKAPASQGSGVGASNAAKPSQRMDPDDPRWGDSEVRANGGSDNQKPQGFFERLNNLGAAAAADMDSKQHPGAPGAYKAAQAPAIAVPKTNPPELINVNTPEMKRQSAILESTDANGRHLSNPSGMTADEKPLILEGINQVTKYNNAVKDIHQYFPEMWKNAGAANDAIEWLGKQHLWGTKAPDMSSWNDASRRYWAAASAVQKIVGNMQKGGGGHELYEMIERELPHNKSTGGDYRRNLNNIERTLRSNIDNRQLLEQRGIINNVPD